jgi:hypothetical protein
VKSIVIAEVHRRLKLLYVITALCVTATILVGSSAQNIFDEPRLPATMPLDDGVVPVWLRYPTLQDVVLVGDYRSDMGLNCLIFVLSHDGGCLRSHTYVGWYFHIVGASEVNLQIYFLKLSFVHD